MNARDHEFLRPQIPLDMAEVGALFELARAFLPNFELPRSSAIPPELPGAAAESRARKAEARYQALIEQIPAVTFMASFENGLSEIYVSPHIETLLGYTAREWIDDPILWYQRLHPGDKERWNQEFTRTVSWAEPFKADYRFLAKDGRVVWIHGEAKVIRDEAGRPSFVQGIGYDITESKNAEEVLRRSAEELEQLVEARTAELSRAEATAMKSLREKETLLKEIHHRVKNNMQLISSLLDLQSAYIKDPQALEVFRECQTRIRSMALIHERLYQASSLAEIDFREYVGSLVAVLTRTYGTRAGAVAVELELAPIALPLDTAIPLGLILNELVSNSLKHAFPDRRTGTIRVALREPQSGRFELSVGDDGVGLPANFDWQNSPSLGLRLIHILVQQIQGALEVTNKSGATFTLTASAPLHKERA